MNLHFPLKYIQKNYSPWTWYITPVHLILFISLYIWILCITSLHFTLKYIHKKLLTMDLDYFFTSFYSWITSFYFPLTHKQEFFTHCGHWSLPLFIVLLDIMFYYFVFPSYMHTNDFYTLWTLYDIFISLLYMIYHLIKWAGVIYQVHGE